MQAILDFVHDHPNWVGFAVVAATLCGSGLLMPQLRRAFRPGPLPDEVNDGAMDAMKALATFLVFVLAVSLNQVMTQQRQAEELVQREASLQTQVDRGLARIGVPALAAQRPVLVAYMRALVEREWPAMARGEHSEEAAELLGQVQRAVRLAEVQTPRQQAVFTDLLRSMEQLSDTRYARLQMSRQGLPALFYAVVAAGFVLLLPVCALTHGNPRSMLLTGTIIASVSLLFTLVMVIDRPFRGETQVSPTPIILAIERNLARLP